MKIAHLVLLKKMKKCSIKEQIPQNIRPNFAKHFLSWASALMTLDADLHMVSINWFASLRISVVRIRNAMDFGRMDAVHME